MDPKEVWQTALGELEVVFSKANFRTWFKDTFILELSEEEVVVGVPNAFAEDWLKDKYDKEIQEALKKIIPTLKKVSYKVSGQTTPPKPTITPEKQTEAAEITHPQLNTKYRFQNFVVGNSNRLAAATAQAISSKPGTVYNPLFLYGGVGLGKTHLVQAIGNEILSKYPAKKIVYVSCERFTNDFISSISNGRINNFKKAYRDVDVLLVDDIQFLSGKEGTQEEFFHTFNTLHQSNRQIVMTSDRIPQAIPQVAERLTSRFGWGMVADIQPPNLEMREAILRSKCQEKNFSLDDDIINYIAIAVESNIRELEGAIIRIMTYCQFNKVTPSLDVTSKVLEDLIVSKGRSLSVDKIIKATGDFFKVSPDELISAKRNKELVWPRQIVMYLLRHEMNMSFPKIGQVLGKKDHSTVMHGVSKIEKEIGANNELKKELTLIKEKLYIA
ncbi:MAG: chromosomal replication initiator protein DnaA [Patescibacteria group bacterium]|nr:chromosomal replication initiator protein DnaA [Patescibacteria group bacterium]